MSNKRRVCGILLIILICFFGCSKKETDEKGQQAIGSTIQALSGEAVNTSGSVKAIGSLLEKEEYQIERTFFYDEEHILAVLGGKYGKKLVGLYNIYTGIYDKEITFTYEGIIDQCTIDKQGNIFLGTAWSGWMMVLNQKLESIDFENKLSAKITTYYVGGDGDYLYYVPEGSKAVWKYEIETQKNTLVMELEEQIDIISLEGESTDGKYIEGSYLAMDGTYGAVLLEVAEKRIIYLNQFDGYLIWRGDMAFIRMDDGESKGYFESFGIHNARIRNQFYFRDEQEGGFFNVDIKQNKVISAAITLDEDSKVQGAEFLLYDFGTGKIENSTQIPLEEDEFIVSSSEELQVSQNAQVVMINYFWGEEKGVFLWNLSIEGQQGKEESETSFLEANNIKQKNEAMVEQIRKEFDVHIYIGDEVIQYFPDFAVGPLYDDKVTYDTLLEVEAVLKKFPSGFFKELCYGDIEEFDIYLCGQLVQGSEEGISSPAGFELEYLDHQIVVIDGTMSSQIRTLLSHEIMHAIENRVLYGMTMEKGKKDILAKWEELNPKKFEYKNSYVDEDGNDYMNTMDDKYTLFDSAAEEDMDIIYFTDNYSKTFAKEDRARIFESLMTAEEELPEEFTSKNLRKKAEYLCEFIRKGMDCMDDKSEEVYYWERLLK